MSLETIWGCPLVRIIFCIWYEINPFISMYCLIHNLQYNKEKIGIFTVRNNKIQTSINEDCKFFLCQNNVSNSIQFPEFLVISNPIHSIIVSSNCVISSITIHQWHFLYVCNVTILVFLLSLLTWYNIWLFPPKASIPKAPSTNPTLKMVVKEEVKWETLE